MPITDNDLALFRERAKTELKSTGDIERLAWDDVVEALCKEVARLRSVSREGGDCAKLREALEALNCIDTRGLKCLLFELVEADIFDHGQINKTISAVDRAKAALAAPPEPLGDNAKLREAIEMIRSEAYECAQGGEYLGEGSDPGFDRIVKLCDAALGKK